LKRRDELLAEGARLGFQTARDPAGRLQYLEEIRPGYTKLVKELLSAEGDHALGALVYGTFSAVAHGTTFGLTSNVELAGSDVTRAPGVTRGAIYTSSQDVVQALTATVLATKTGHERRNELFGWASDSWELGGGGCDSGGEPFRGVPARKALSQGFSREPEGGAVIRENICS
jgi:hypothetical protein